MCKEVEVRSRSSSEELFFVPEIPKKPLEADNIDKKKNKKAFCLYLIQEVLNYHCVWLLVFVIYMLIVVFRCQTVIGSADSWKRIGP